MADLFTLMFDVGPDAAMSRVTQMVTDIGTITDAAMTLAPRVADIEARNHVAEEVRLRGSSGLRDLLEAEFRSLGKGQRKIAEGDMRFLMGQQKLEPSLTRWWLPPCRCSFRE